jgi:general secretion pathway protein A
MRTPVFSISPDPTCMYLTPALRDGVAKIRRAIDLRQGLCTVFGSNGYGKSSLLRHLAAGFSAQPNYRVALIAESTDAPRFAFLRKLADELEIKKPARAAMDLMMIIQEFLFDEHKAKRTVVVMVDEAQLLRTEVMESLRSLLNFETHTEKTAQIVLAGQLELRDRMLKPRYKAFRSRIIAPVVLEYFSLEETAGMIAYRHEYWGVPNRFSAPAISRIHGLTGGVPRDIVALCGYAMSAADDSGAASIKPADIDRAAEMLNMRSEREAVATV